MKKTYLNPEAMIMTIANEDILTGSGSPLSVADNILGYDDNSPVDNLFG